MELNLIIVLKFVSLVSVGIVAGATVYSSFVEIPIRTKTSEEEQLKNWKLVFPRASNLLKKYGIVTMFSILTTWYLTANYYWFLGVIPLFILIPFTKIFIVKVNNKIMSLPDSKGVAEIIENWDKLHFVRTALAIISFILCVLAVII